MSQAPLEDQWIGAWLRHDEISLLLLDRIPPGGETAVPSQSRGRTVAEQFAHMDRVRRGWLEYHATGKHPQMEKTVKGSPPPMAQLREQLAESGEEVARYLGKVLRGDAKIRMFGKCPVRWMCYLIAHESHHRGQIMLALKQNGVRLPPAVSMEGLWGKWMGAS